MKAYFKRLLNYDHAQNLQMLKGMDTINAAGQPVKLMSHLLMAQQVWLARCSGQSTAGIVLWPELPLDNLLPIAQQNHEEWQAYFDTISDDDDFSRIISYTNFRGDKWNNRLDDILAHVINHGTHHRAQIGQLLKHNGLEQLPVTDYIFYIREN